MIRRYFWAAFELGLVGGVVWLGFRIVQGLLLRR